MLVAILSDTHGQVERVRAALREIERRGVELILHCGDIDDAATVRLFPAHTHFVPGNCDAGQATAIRRAIGEIGATLHEGWGHLDLEGVAVAFIHGDQGRTLAELENSQAFDFLFHGHTHVAGERRSGRTRVINPGALHRASVKTFLLLELPAGTTESITLS